VEKSSSHAGGVFHTVEKSSQFFHTMEKLCAIFPRNGKTLGSLFHAMEKLCAIFPRCGKNISTLWKKVADFFHAVEKSLSRIGGMFHGMERTGARP
ncbi:MAG TPA: hypothetical protein PLT12_10510, partial [Kiritimatiellia bacterium]|nr:hypothetical protein [Kiritimatiellia bacterium]